MLEIGRTNAKIKYIEKLRLGDQEMVTLCYSPYPEEYEKLSQIFVCDHCLKYMRKSSTFDRHRQKCAKQTPPGQQVYHDSLAINGAFLSVYKVDGHE